MPQADEEPSAVRMQMVYMRERVDKMRRELDSLADWLASDDDDDGEFDCEDALANLGRWAKQVRRCASNLNNEKDED